MPSVSTARNAAGGTRRRPSSVTPQTRRPPADIAADRCRAADGIDAYVQALADASPMQIVQLEREGVQGSFIKELSRRMGIPASRFFVILGLPKATVEKKAAAGERVGGSGGRAAVGLVRLLVLAQRIVADSTAPQAGDFDVPRWLGLWIERPQPSLGGRRPSELIDTPSGMEMVARLLGSLESGAYQ
jgi:putative toxin-antitoxin system antitoxin component (TIGR02293 family)